MHKILGLIVSVSLLILSQQVWSGEQKILFVNATHRNKAKLSLLKEMAVEKGITIERKPQSELSDLTKAAAIFSTYDLVVMEAVSVRESKQI